MLACTVGSSGLETPFALQGDGVTAVVSSEGGCGQRGVRVGLWGEGFGTRGEVLADVVPDDDGSTWLHFSVYTGLGEAVAALRIEGDSGLLPLGIRPGEHELRLKKAALKDVDLEGAAAMSAESQAKAVKEWEAGAFLLREGEDTVGEIRFRGDSPPMVTVFDKWWLTPRPVEAAVSSQGAELLIAFDVEPSLQGEGGLLRVNLPLRQAVAPIGDVPVDAERRFELVAGALGEGDFETASAAAQREADEMEVTAVESTAKRIATQARQSDGSCLSWEALEETWGVMLAGYDVSLSSHGDGCAVTVEAAQVQHSRRYRGLIVP